jgi:glycosyltransferase involved in cell wall biosynthesis
MLCWLPRFRRHFDAILTFEHSNFTKLLRQCLKPGGFIIAAYAGELPRAPQANSIRRSCDALLVESDIHREAFRRLSGENFPIRVAPHLGHYAAPPARDAFHKEALRVAFLGRFDRAKGVHQLLDTWPTLQLGNAELHFYGDGPERQAMAQRISKQSIAGVFLHRGWMGAKELAVILGEVDLLVLPSSSEGLPLVLLEAMAHGVPFVATDVGAVSILAHGNPDVMVAPREADFGASIQEMAARIRNGSVQPRRLQRYFDERFSFTRSGQIWLNALLHPQTFWTEEIDRPASRRA